MLLDNLEKKKLISPPSFVVSNCAYLTIMGSHAYGVADTSVKDKIPDYDIYGFCIPPKNYIFPQDIIPGFGTPPPRFDQYQQHHIVDPDGLGGHGQEYDLQVFNIVKYFELCRGGNPNIIDSLFTPTTCVLHSTQVGVMVRDNRKLFLSKEIWKKFRGYAQSQLHKMDSKNPEGGRKEIVEKFGYDVKFAYHLVRLLNEAEMILMEGDLDLQKSKEVLKAIRRGDWKQDEIRSWANEKDKVLEVAYVNSTLPVQAPEDKLKVLLLNCLEAHYGSLDKLVRLSNKAELALEEIRNVLDRYR